MKKAIVKTTLAVTMMFSSVLGHAGATEVTATKAPAAAPVMTDNLFKYGLKKDVELPVTVTAGGLSYTLEKIMIYDAKSKDAQGLSKKYGYNINDAQYFIWTKITVENKSGNLVQQNVKDLKDKWRLNFGDLSKGEAYTSMPNKMTDIKNSNQALWDWSLKPGEKLSTYQAYLYNGDFNYFVIWLDNKNASATKYIVKDMK